MPDTPSRVLLLDGHSLAYRAFYALPVENFSTTTGQPTNAVYGFASMLITLLRDERPDVVAVAFDVSRQTFRSEAFPEYKATRRASPEGFSGQVELVKELLRTLGIRTLEAPGFEADDIIATLAREAVEAGDAVAIVTGDRDAFQLVSDAVTVLYPRKGVSDLARMTPEAVEEKYGLQPGQYPDFAALRGDPSDNLPGIPGVGEKTATKWIREYGSLAGIVDAAGSIGGKAGEALRAALPQVLLNRQLTHLRDDVPLPIGLSDCGLVGWDQDEVDALFDTLQFRALRDRLMAQNPRARAAGGDAAAGAAVSASAPDPHHMPEPDAVSAAGAMAWLQACTPPVAVAFGGTWGRGTGELEQIAVVDASGRCGVLEATPDALRWLADPAVPVRAHDAKGPWLALLEAGSPGIGCLDLDTALAAYVISSGERSFALEDVTRRLLARDLAEQDGVGDQLFADEAVQARVLAARARAVADLAEPLELEVVRQGCLPLLREVEQPLTGLLARMEHAGIAVDLEALVALSAEFAAEVRATEERAHALVGRPFNLGSPKQLQEILFGERSLPKTKRIKTGYTTDAEALAWLFEQTQDPLCGELLAWRDRSRLRQVVDGLIPLAAVDGRVHTTFQQTVAATGRLSSTDPNLQNIPIRTEAGRRIRDCFVVGAGYEALLTADYSQIEMRIMAHASGDAGLIEAFRSGEDLHTTVAAQVFDVPPGEVTAEMRRRTKAMSYGLAYGLSAFGLGQQLGIPPDEARGLMDTYFARFGGVRDYLADVVEEARVRGYTETMLGRRRFLPDLASEQRQRREMAERMALNAPIQGTAADIVKVAMIRVDDRLAAGGLRSRLLLQVHDELVLEVAPGERAAVEALVREAMAGAADLTVPLDVSVGWGRSWDSAAH